MSPLALAVAHHLLVFSLVAVLAAEAGLVRRGMTGADVRRVAKIDASYGVLAVLILIVGFSRAVWGAKGWTYYAENPWFHAKMASFLAVGLLSIPPTVRFIRWRRAQKAGGSDAPADADVAGVRRWFYLQAVFLALVPAFAAAMAGWGEAD
jgi:putative membrane protein